MQTDEHFSYGPGPLFHDAARIFSDFLDETIPPEAYEHLRAAERELLLAFAVTLEYHANKRSPVPRKRKAKQPLRAVKIQLAD